MEPVININEADEQTFATLPGISMKLAQRIVAYREEQGAFADVQELTAVSGISSRMVEQMSDRMTVGDAAAPATAVPDEAVSVETAEPEQPTEKDDVASEEEELADVTAVPLLTIEDEELESMPSDETSPPDKQEVPPTMIMPTAAPAAKQGSMMGSLIAAVFGAILGTTLTLSILYGFNQTLQYTSSAQTSDLELVLANELEALQDEQQQIQNDIAALNEQVTTLSTNQSESATAMATAQGELESLQSRASDLQTQADTLGERLEAVAESAENFDTFLTGLRDLLVNVAGPLPTAVPTATATNTPTTAAATTSPTATIDSAATRTPRPTATSIALPTTTPTVNPQP